MWKRAYVKIIYNTSLPVLLRFKKYADVLAVEIPDLQVNHHHSSSTFSKHMLHVNYGSTLFLLNTIPKEYHD
jgi:hypothetical protein